MVTSTRHLEEEGIRAITNFCTINNGVSRNRDRGAPERRLPPRSNEGEGRELLLVIVTLSGRLPFPAGRIEGLLDVGHEGWWHEKSRQVFSEHVRSHALLEGNLNDTSTT